MASVSDTDSVSDSASINICVPQGLLHSANSDLYAYSRRHPERDEREAHTLGRIVEQPSQGVLVVDSLQRSRTLDLASRTGSQRGVRRALTNASQRPSMGVLQVPQPSLTQHQPGLPQDNTGFSGQQGPSGRINSIGMASFVPGKSQRVPPARSPVFREHSGASNHFAGAPTRPSQARVLSRNLPSTESASTKSSVQIVERPIDAWSPTHQSGRLSIHGPEQIPPHHLRHGSFVPGPDTLSVRRPTSHSISSRASIARKFSLAVGNAVSTVVPRPRMNSIRNTYERAKVRQKQLQRSKPVQLLFQYLVYLLLFAFVYFVLVGRPLWGGGVWYVYVLFENDLTLPAGSAIFIGLAFFYAFGPLLVLFEPPAPMLPKSHADIEKPYFPPASFIRGLQAPSPVATALEAPVTTPPKHDPATETALLIPCYKSAKLLPATLDAALRIFPATSIFILANGNSPTPLDDTEQVCSRFQVNHVWIPVGSKIVAQYVGAYVARSFRHALLIDDDCILPPNFPIVTDRLRGRVRCLGYTLASIGPNRSRGSWCQQAQDLEYKLSGLQRQFAGRVGSATFPHGAIVLWETAFLIQTFNQHPGFSVSEDWFFGHVARESGSRITMCSSVFVETETPASVFWSGGGGERGGFGEMTVFKQRFKRWNFFFVNGCYYNLLYILFSWRLGFWELGAKLFVFQEIYETFLYLVTPIVLPISFIVRPRFSTYLLAATLGLYFANAIIFNEVHLRWASRSQSREDEAGGTSGQKKGNGRGKWHQERSMMVNRRMLVLYYMPFKFILTFVNVASCWWSLWQYAKYFAKRHPRIVEDERAVGVVLKIEEKEEAATRTLGAVQEVDEGPEGPTDEEDLANKRLRRLSGGDEGAADPKHHPPRVPMPSRLSSRSRSQRSVQSTNVVGRGPRRMTVTAVKVDVVTAPVAPEREAGDDGVAPDEITGQPVEETDALSWASRRRRRRSSIAVVAEHLNNWAPNWLTGARDGGRHEHREPELPGYSYYDV